ncbi:MAG: glucose-1-phosphate adenylyltransferase subunit GlgD [Lachnoclostridium sp.]|nr:glucose-1-phosphate adenylyltransferase subunit GlgD [Lachnospira sp.]MCM1248516.1 glucose-1-phosphate adenylyltransferase subunit GlgD [Lachnoclostridium sp.]MCM1535322.1 glucose-1-phosphate adenylyltransferase subunit GlgD [Clostridium sp.]
MVNTNLDALAIIFPNSYDNEVPSLVNERLMASIPFASRYRIIDFMLSSFVNCGIDNISIIVRKNYRSLMRHLGNGREWDLSRKNGGLNIVPPFAEKTVKVYNGRVEALASITEFLKHQKEKYVFISDANIVANFDFNTMLDAHIAADADVTIAYKEEPIPYGFMNLQTTTTTDLYYTLSMDEGRVTELHINPKEYGPQNFSMNIYLIERELLIKQIEQAYANGYVYFERDILSPQLSTLKVYGYKYEGYTSRISDMVSYFTENMRLLQDDNLEALFGHSPIYTKIRDDNPTRYIGKAKVKNAMVADGCVIEGEVENCILFRGVKIARGAVVRNSIIMQDTTIMGNADIDYVITDKEVTITAGKELKGNASFPVFVPAYKEI